MRWNARADGGCTEGRGGCVVFHFCHFYRVLSVSCFARIYDFFVKACISENCLWLRVSGGGWFTGGGGAYGADGVAALDTSMPSCSIGGWEWVRRLVIRQKRFNITRLQLYPTCIKCNTIMHGFSYHRSKLPRRI